MRLNLAGRQSRERHSQCMHRPSGESMQPRTLMRVREVTAPDLEVEARARRPTENVVLRMYDSSYSMPVSEATVKEVGQFEYYTQ